MTFSNFAPVAPNIILIKMYFLLIHYFFFVILMDWFSVEKKINGDYKELLSPNSLIVDVNCFSTASVNSYSSKFPLF